MSTPSGDLLDREVAGREWEGLRDLALRSNPRLNQELIERAYWRAWEVHRDQKRLSGEPYFSHVLAVARTCAEMNLGSDAIAAALLHDSIEDSPVTAEALAKEFNPTVSLLVDGVSKISGLRFESREKAQAENFRKLLLHMSRDVRILLVKLADRLHNVSTLEPMRPEKQTRIARETMDIYAPLANRLGMGRIKWQLEDHAFKYLNPEAYGRVASMVGMQREAREEFIVSMRDRLQDAMNKNGIDCAVQGRAKHLHSIHRKMRSQNLREGEVFDLLAFRIITATVEDCYHALGVIHSLFTPIPNKFKDYIATPKRNGYQSLHTALVGAEGRTIEVQIRTQKMHEIAEYGVASHWRYKEEENPSPVPGGEAERELDFLRTFIQDLEEGEWSEDPSEFMEELKVSLFQEGIFAFTPRGDLHILPVGATPVDFAYSIHTGVGDRCIGARVDSKMVPLRRPLTSGEVVEIVTRNDARPSRDWLSFVKTSKAQSRIRKSIREQESEQSESLGHELLEREFKRNRQSMPDEATLKVAAEAFGMDSVDRLVQGVGRGSVSALQVFHRVHPPEDKKSGIIESAQKLTQLATSLGGRRQKGVRVEGHGNMLIHFAGCCRPVPGDRIVGVITRGRGVSIHRQDCVNIVGDRIAEERRMRVDWDAGEDEKFLVSIQIHGDDRKNLLADITGQISKSDVGIQGGSFRREEKDLSALVQVTIEIRDLKQLEKIIRDVRRVSGVRQVERV